MLYIFTFVFISHLLFANANETGKDELQWLTSDSLTKKKIITTSDKEKIYELEVRKSDEENKWHYIFCDFPIGEGQFVHANAQMRLVWCEDSIGGGLSISFIDSERRRIEYVEERLTEPTRDYIPIKLYAKTPPNTRKVRVSIYIHNKGKIESTEPIFSHLHIKNACSEDIVQLNIRKKPIEYRLIGFGAEDDGRFYDKNNSQGGVDEEAIKIRKNRLSELKPHWVRTFIWFKDWNPLDDGETFTFESDGMQSLCRTLQEYKDLNTDVNITCVDWGIKDTWENTEKRVKTIIALLNYLIKTKKFDNIKYFTLTNEPNYFFKTNENRFNKFTQLHKLLKEEFRRKNIKLKIIGSDDAMGTDWFDACLKDKDYSNTVNLWASHFYWHFSTSYFSNELFKTRLELVKNSKINSKKPFVVTEFGITDHRFQPPSINPIMQEYEGALYTYSAMIDGLNQGVSGFSIWCLQEVRYPGSKEPMRIGLWGYADKNWQLFPIYHALKIFTNNTQPGDKIYPIITTNPVFVKITKVGEKLFWANLSNKQQKIEFKDKNKQKHVYIYENTKEMSNIHCKTINTNDNIIFLPARSFGVIDFKN